MPEEVNVRVVKAKRKKLLLRAMGLCTMCHKRRLYTTTRCKACTEVVNAKARERKAGWLAAGLCGVCGKKPSLPGKKCCERCRVRMNTHAINKRRKAKCQQQ